MKRKLLLDVLFYLLIPLAVWNLGREHIGDYLAILFGMAPGLIYTIVDALVSKEVTVTGVFFFSVISLNFIFNLFSKTATQEIWNMVYMGYISMGFYLLTMLFRRPIGVYFFVDYAHARGTSRKESMALYMGPKNRHYFYWFTGLLVLRELVVVIVVSFMIWDMGVEGFNTIQITSSVINYAFTGLTVWAVIWVLKQIGKNQAAAKESKA